MSGATRHGPAIWIGSCWLAALAVIASPVLAQDAPPKPSPAPTRGPGVAQIGEIAQLTLPENVALALDTQLRRLPEDRFGKGARGFIGMLGAKNKEWKASLTFARTGPIESPPVFTADARELMAAIHADPLWGLTAPGRSIGWEREPVWDANRQMLRWALRVDGAISSATATRRYTSGTHDFTAFVTRDGFLLFELSSIAAEAEAHAAELATLVNSLELVAGQRVSDRGPDEVVRHDLSLAVAGQYEPRPKPKLARGDVKLWVKIAVAVIALIVMTAFQLWRRRSARSAT